MEQRTIKEGFSVSVLGLGCGPLGGLYDRLDEEQASATVAAALDAGITYFDAAPLYGMGLAEHRLGTALRRRRDGAVISTKVGRLLRPAGPSGAAPSMFHDALPFEAVYDYSRDGVMRSVEDSLQRLGTDHIDILYIHDVNRRWHGDAVEARFQEVMEGGYRALDDLRAAGAVKAIGVGVNDPDILVRFAESGNFDVAHLAYANFKSTLLQEPTVDQIIPVVPAKIANDTGKVASAAVEYEPDEEAILADLLPRNVAIQIYRALLENAAGFYGSQMTAMDNATRNAGDMINKLSIAYNRQRQAAITTELVEIISGAEAL